MTLARWLVVVYVSASLCAFIAYAWDKAAARAGNQRIPESFLHLLAVIGGWPGAWLAQQLFRHKTVKQPFRSIFWLTVLLNLAAVAGVLNWLAQGG